MYENMPFKYDKARREGKRVKEGVRDQILSVMRVVSDVAIHARLGTLLSTVDLLCHADVHTDFFPHV